MPKKRIELPTEEIVDAYEEGVSIEWLAEYYGVSTSTIRVRRREGGVILGYPRLAKDELPPVSSVESLTQLQRDTIEMVLSRPCEDPLLIGTRNAWLYSLPNNLVLKIENHIKEKDREEWITHLLMVHVGGPGYTAHQRMFRGRDHQSKVLQIVTSEPEDKLEEQYRDRTSTCIHSLDGGETWEPFDPPPSTKRRKYTIKSKKFRKEAAYDLRRMGLLPRQRPDEERKMRS